MFDKNFGHKIKNDSPSKCLLVPLVVPEPLRQVRADLKSAREVSAEIIIATRAKITIQ